MDPKGLAIASFLAAAAPVGACGVPGNLVANCGFTSGSSGWSLVFPLVYYLSADGSSGSGPGCLEGLPVSSQVPFFGFQQCVTGLSPNTGYGYGIDSRAVAPSAGSSCSVGVSEFSDGACGGSPLVGHGQGLALTGVWTQADGSFTSTATTHSAVFSVFCSEAAPEPTLQVRFDDAFLGPGLTPVELQRFVID